MIKRTITWRTIVLLSIFGQFAQGEPAEALGGSDMTPSEHYIRAETLLKEGKYLQAAQHYQHSDVDEHPANLYNAGVCYDRAKSLREALSLYQQYLRKIAEKVSDARSVEDARRRVIELSLSEANEAFKNRYYSKAIRAAQSVLANVDSLELFREAHLLIGKSACGGYGTKIERSLMLESHRVLDNSRQKTLREYCWTGYKAYDGKNFYGFNNRRSDNATVPPASAKRIDDNISLVQLSADGEPVQNSEFQKNSARVALISSAMLRTVISPEGRVAIVEDALFSIRMVRPNPADNDPFSKDIIKCTSQMKPGLTYRCYVKSWGSSRRICGDISEAMDSIKAVDIIVQQFE